MHNLYTAWLHLSFSKQKFNIVNVLFLRALNSQATVRPKHKINMKKITYYFPEQYPIVCSENSRFYTYSCNIDWRACIFENQKYDPKHQSDTKWKLSGVVVSYLCSFSWFAKLTETRAKYNHWPSAIIPERN